MAPQARPQRTTYQTARVRPTSLDGNRDVVLIDGDWREVFDVYTYANVAELLEIYAHDREMAAWIKRHLAEDTHELYAIVRYLVEAPGAAELTTQIKLYRRCELVTVQDPEPETDLIDPIAEVLGALHGEVGSDGEVEVLEALSIRAGLVWVCRAETCERHNTYNQDACDECGAPRTGAAES